jgi:hypothetical protein
MIFCIMRKQRFVMNREPLTLNGEECKMVNKTKQFGAGELNKLKIGQIKLPPRTESILWVPVKLGSPPVGMTNRCKIQEGVVMAASLT